jgi:hypothetical protein
VIVCSLYPFQLGYHDRRLTTFPAPLKPPSGGCAVITFPAPRFPFDRRQMGQRPVHDLLERQAWAASSRNAVIDRCNRIINGDFFADKDILPRSGPWKHRLVDPHKALRKTTGRCVHS